MEIVIIGIVVVLFLMIVSNIKVVPQARACIVERLGAYNATWKTGVHVKIPFIDRVAKNMSLKEQVLDFPPQPVITSDN
ncbi:MAG: peptidase, partial [Clostridia bacterium]|nr:peptidase [Clostridia bacterium]